METQQFTKEIDASVETVYNAMIGQETYKLWTAPFDPSSDFEGSWDKGSKIIFTAVGKEGRREGMVARIEENDPNRYVAIRHMGMLDGDKEITEGPAVADWAGAMETYTFSEQNGKTTVTVHLDTNEQFANYMKETWPKALEALKEVSEKG